jgi:hypothetical protein
MAEQNENQGRERTNQNQKEPGHGLFFPRKILCRSFGASSSSRAGLKTQEMSAKHECFYADLVDLREQFHGHSDMSDFIDRRLGDRV